MAGVALRIGGCGEIARYASPLGICYGASCATG